LYHPSAPVCGRGHKTVAYLPLLVLFLVPFPLSEVVAQDAAKLSMRQGKFPKAFFFRSSEQAFNRRRYPTYEAWDSQFNRLQGIMGKCLDEECLGREPRNPEFFNRFKQLHPDQVVLLHFNGNARDPRYHTEPYFAGHWIYRQAVLITEDVEAEEGETDIHVQDVRGFRVDAGRYKTSNDDVALLRMTPDGKHDWHHCEQVQLLSIDRQAKTIRVRRGCYGTKPLALKGGQSRAAAHQVEGPWGRNNNLMWYYNFSQLCPADRHGRTCRDLLVEDLARWFADDGLLSGFDGLEFDVMFHQTRGDTDGDGVEDDGVIDGVNQYGIGVIEFARQLRRRMGDDFVMQGDGALGPGGSRSQRAWGLLNGIESEGWPNLNDWEFNDWSGGLNRHFFWRDNARPPAFNYVNHKWNMPVPGEPGARRHPDVPFSRHRLVLAACQFFDAATCYSWVPPNYPDGKLGIWDELCCGTENRLQWLGRPEGPAQRLATRYAENLLSDGGLPATLARRVSGAVTTEVTADGVRIRPVSDRASNLKFFIRGVPMPRAKPSGSERDLYLEVVLQGEPRMGYPAEMARFAEVGVSGGMTDLMSGQAKIGMKLRGADQEAAIDSGTGAVCRLRASTIAGETRQSYFVHPPYQGNTGYTFWEQQVDVPAHSELRFWIGMGEKSPERSDGVCFQVLAAVTSSDGAGNYVKLFEAITKQHKWLPHSVSLSQFAGKRLRLKFIADCGPNDNATTDHAHWGGVRIVPAGDDDRNITEFQQYMTWVNDKPFRSSFYYHQIKSDEVDVTFDVEGNEPVLIRSMAAYNHPDAICRVFEQGMVLANPSRRPYTFDLQKLTPGRKYGRIQGSPRQDPHTNNGQPVAGPVTLGARDALFLKRVD
jgi:hypothetical protein